MYRRLIALSAVPKSTFGLERVSKEVVISSSSCAASTASTAIRRTSCTTHSLPTTPSFTHSTPSWTYPSSHRYFSSESAAANDGNDDDTAASKNARNRRTALRNRRKERQTRRSKRKTAATTNNSSRQITRHDAAAFGRLFDKIAPTHSLAKLAELVARLQAKILSDISNVLPLMTVLLGMLHSTNPNNAVQIDVLEFLLSATKGSSLKNGASTTATTASDTSAAENGGDEDLIKEVDAVATLMAAREHAMQHAAIGWSKLDLEELTKDPAVLEERQALHAIKSETELQQEAQQLAQTLMASLPSKTFRSVIRIFEAYVDKQGPSSEDAEGVLLLSEAEQDDDSDSSTVSDEPDHDNDEVNANAEVETEATAAATDIPTTRKKRKDKKRGLRILRFELEKITGAQFHLVAADTADFFYMNIGIDYNVTTTSAAIIRLQAKWTQARERFVESMTGIQDKVLASVEELGSEIEVIDSTDSSEPELELSVKALVEKKKIDRRFRRPAHVAFDAMVLHEAVRHKVDGEDPALATLPSQTVVFVDNLPIDVTTKELTKLYSRCGDLSSVQIFNQQPDLDPGPLKRKAIAARRKKQLQSVSYFRKWQRPRTPVYGMLSFSSPEGSQSALNDSLRIFGILLRKHPVRSARSSDMKSLYLEGLPDSQACIDLEYQLSKQLHPDLFVCLDAGQNNRAMVGSCEINFPSFEAALDSYHKLHELDLLSGSDSTCKLNWFRTPPDATSWWTRQQGFD